MQTEKPDPAASGEVFRVVLDQLPAAVYVIDADGMLTYYNAAAAELWGHRPKIGEAKWNGAIRLYHPNGGPMPHDESSMAVALREGKAKMGLEEVAERPDGSRVPFFAHPVAFINDRGEVTGGLNLLVDSSEHTSMQQYVERLSAIVQSSHDAIISKDLNGIITSWNRGAERLFGYSAAEAIGRPITMLIPADRHNEEPEILSRIRRGEIVEPYETIRQRKDGSQVPISLSVSPIRDITGRIVGASKIAQDITENIRLREQQHLMVREVNHRIKNLIATVQAIARRTISFQSDSERDVFFARLSALAGANQLLNDHTFHEIPINVAVERAIEPFRAPDRDRFILSGSGGGHLKGENGSQLAMVLHELATNAVKYGALSNNDGEVHIDWQVGTGDEADTLTLVWQEKGGPPVAPPKRDGFGSQLIRRVFSGDEGGVELDFLPDGVRCTLSLRITCLASG